MKKIALLGLILLFAAIVSATAPPFPMPVNLGFTYNGNPVSNLAVELYFNDEKIVRNTNEVGRLVVDVGKGSPDFATAKTVNSGTLRVKVLNIDKSYDTLTLDTPYKEDLSLTTAPPVSCPVCPSCGGGGGGGVAIICTKEKCATDFPCPEPTTEYKYLPCKSEDCADVVCDTCEEKVCEECPDCPKSGNLNSVIVAIITFLAGGGIVYITFGRANRVRVKKLPDGTYETQHQHPGISGYHNINTVHRDSKIAHKKGELVPVYEKDIDGKWIYKG